MSAFKLRPYQIEGKIEIRALFSKERRKVIFCSPTGSGKTVTFADMARESVKNGFKVLIVVDRKELLEQAKSKLTAYGLNPSIITAGRTGRSNNTSFIATVQTLVRRDFPPVDLIIIDEAHKQIFDKVLLREEYKDTFVIGATATPYRTGRMGQLSDLYSDIVETVTINDLIKSGFLTPAITYGAKVDTSKIKIKRGDFDTQDLYKAFDKQVLYTGVIEKYRKFANNTKALCFNINVEHSKKVTAAFNLAGISAVHLDGKTPKAERAKILDNFSKGYFKVLCNVDVLTAGFDEWTIETVIVNLATKSLTKWLQMNGRGSRITPEEFKNNDRYLQKEHFNIIDMGGNVFNLGFWEQNREFNLTHKVKATIDPAPVKICKEDVKDINNNLGCGALVHLSAAKCKFCNYVFPKEIKKEIESEFVQLENNQYLPPELIGKTWGSMTVAELEEVRIIKGYKMGWIVRNILLNKDLELIDYARLKGYKNAAKWVERMNEMYIK
jgi:superfamily II DNA or RNA helicase